MLKSVDEVIEKLGGNAEVAKLTGVSTSAVSNWRQRGHIPSDKYLRVNGALKREGVSAHPKVFSFTLSDQQASA